MTTNYDLNFYQKKKGWLNLKQLQILTGFTYKTLYIYLAFPRATKYKRSLEHGKRTLYLPSVLKYLRKEKVKAIKRRGKSLSPKRFRYFICTRCKKKLSIKADKTTPHVYKYCRFCQGDLQEIGYGKGYRYGR